MNLIYKTVEKTCHFLAVIYVISVVVLLPTVWNMYLAPEYLSTNAEFGDGYDFLATVLSVLLFPCAFISARQLWNKSPKHKLVLIAFLILGFLCSLLMINLFLFVFFMAVMMTPT